VRSRTAIGGRMERQGSGGTGHRACAEDAWILGRPAAIPWCPQGPSGWGWMNRRWWGPCGPRAARGAAPARLHSNGSRGGRGGLQATSPRQGSLLFGCDRSGACCSCWCPWCCLRTSISRHAGDHMQEGTGVSAVAQVGVLREGNASIFYYFFNASGMILHGRQRWGAHPPRCWKGGHTYPWGEFWWRCPGRGEGAALLVDRTHTPARRGNAASSCQRCHGTAARVRGTGSRTRCSMSWHRRNSQRDRSWNRCFLACLDRRKPAAPEERRQAKGFVPAGIHQHYSRLGERAVSNI